MPRLPRDRVVIITGASAGIGRATAMAFARDGARLVIGSRRGSALAQVARDINDLGGQAIAKPTDVSRRADLKALVDIATRKWGAVHVLINNAGIGLYGPVESIWEGDFDKLMSTNVKGALHGIQEVLPVMKAQGMGQIINVTSTLGRVAIPLMSMYCMTKFALEALSQSLRIEVRRHGIDVIVVAPGATETEFSYNAKVRGIKRNPYRDNGGRVRPERVAAAILSASRRRKRDVTLNVASKALIAANALSGRFSDWVLTRWAGSRLAEDPQPLPVDAPADEQS